MYVLWNFYGKMSSEYAKSVCLFETYESESSNFITWVVVHIVAIQNEMSGE